MACRHLINNSQNIFGVVDECLVLLFWQVIHALLDEKLGRVNIFAWSVVDPRMRI